MDFVYVILAGGAATLAMTVFSYLVSNIFSKRYREPLLLNYMIRGSESMEKVGRRSYWGYIIHFIIGWILAFLFYFLLEIDMAELNVRSGIIFGFISGIIGSGAWFIIFKTNSNPPKINLGGYFFQLLIAHVIFGATLSWVLFILYQGHGY